MAPHLLGWDHLEWWVGNARAFSSWLSNSFGFEVAAYLGPETGCRDRVSYLLEQGSVHFVVSAGLAPDSEICAHVREHGDGVRNLAWTVADPVAAVELAERNGARVVAEPTTEEHDEGSVTTAAIATYGETRHVFVDRSRWEGVWGPGFSVERLPRRPDWTPVGLTGIDHVVGNVEEGRLDEWVAWYREVLGFDEFQHFGAEQISTAYSALNSTVVSNGGPIVMPINEPAPGLRKSQITEYLEAYRGPGVQHIALSTPNIIASVAEMTRRMVRFLDMPDTYYEDARVRCANLDVPWQQLQQHGIEIDQDSGGYLLQIFSDIMGDRPTVFMEIIEREGAQGFGEGNFKALFEAIEREQARRHNL